jgi:predicted kinase
VIIVCGLQGAGKSSWIKLYGYRYSPCIFFDAALPGARHRGKVSQIAKQFGTELWVVWIKTSLAIALQRNALRAMDERVPEKAIRSVAELFEPPTMDEGFDKIIILDYD